MFAFNSPFRDASTIAWKLEPSPEARTAIFIFFTYENCHLGKKIQSLLARGLQWVVSVGGSVRKDPCTLARLAMKLKMLALLGTSVLFTACGPGQQSSYIVRNGTRGGDCEPVG